MIRKIVPENQKWYYNVKTEELMDFMLSEEKKHGRAMLI